MLAHVHSLCYKPVIWRYQLGMYPKRTLNLTYNGMIRPPTVLNSYYRVMSGDLLMNCLFSLQSELLAPNRYDVIFGPFCLGALFLPLFTAHSLLCRCILPPPLKKPITLGAALSSYPQRTCTPAPIALTPPLARGTSPDTFSSTLRPSPLPATCAATNSGRRRTCSDTS